MVSQGQHGDKQKSSFENKVHFNVSVLEYKGNDTWIENTILEIKKLLDQNIVPSFTENCDYCIYIQDLETVL